MNTLYSLSKNVTHEAVQFLLRMLTWDPRKRITISQPLGMNFQENINYICDVWFSRT